MDTRVATARMPRALAFVGGFPYPIACVNELISARSDPPSKKLRAHTDDLSNESGFCIVLQASVN